MRFSNVSRRKLVYRRLLRGNRFFTLKKIRLRSEKQTTVGDKSYGGRLKVINGKGLKTGQPTRVSKPTRFLWKVEE